MRRFHNFVKRKYISKYSSDTVLDLAAGKGGDFGKYIDTNNKYIEAYDNDKNSIKHAISRKDNFLLRPESKNIVINIYNKDLTTHVVKSKVKFDLIVCNFAFHYFYNSLDIFISSIINNSKENTYIILSFFDKNLIREIDTDYLNIKKINENEIEVYLRDSVLDKPRKEYLVDIENVISKFKEYDINLVENTNFSTIYKEWSTYGNSLSDVERDFSFMNNTLVFKK
jgi:SAM-dependent methyltransferase